MRFDAKTWYHTTIYHQKNTELIEINSNLVMRLSKKTKDNENKKEVVEGLTRLVCTSKNHTTLLNGN